MAPLQSTLLDVINPSTEESFVQIAVGGPADVDRAVAAARAAFPSFARTTRMQRLDLLRAILSEYQKRRQDIAETLSREMGADAETVRGRTAERDHLVGGHGCRGRSGRVYNMVQGEGGVVGAAMSAQPDIDMISFTGSTRAGILVAQAAATKVKRVAYEHGGKSANILLPDVDFKTAVTKGMLGMMGNSGQSCNAPHVRPGQSAG